MTGKYPYSYSLLRYVHDPLTGEFVNVGVALFSPSAHFLAAKCRKRVGRLSKIFPGIDKTAFREAVQFFETRFTKLGKQVNAQMNLESSGSVIKFCKSILPSDDSAFQWSEVRSGLSDDLSETVKHLYGRMVVRYDEPVTQRKKSDEDVWRVFKAELQQRQVLIHFHSKTIRSTDDTLEIEHAWKNGAWHCLEPLSFDLSDADHIRDKAYRWLGHLTNVQDSPEDFKIYFLLGKPKERKLSKAFKSAIRILEKVPVDKEIFLESDVTDFSDKFEDAIKSVIGKP